VPAHALDRPDSPVLVRHRRGAKIVEPRFLDLSPRGGPPLDRPGTAVAVGLAGLGAACIRAELVEKNTHKAKSYATKFSMNIPINSAQHPSMLDPGL